MKQNEIILNAGRAFLTIKFTKTVVQNREAPVKDEFSHLMISAVSFKNLVQKKKDK